jgi:hypothetical protein
VLNICNRFHLNGEQMSTEDRDQKNAVFTQGQQLPPGVDPRMPRQSATEKAKADFGLDIPQELVPLPSMGKVYHPESNLFGLETVEIKAMTAKEEDILTSRALLKKGTVISELIKSCLVDRSIDPLQLLSGDRNALMISIRITGYGPEYNVEMECGECGVKSPHAFDLASLPIKRLEIDPVQDGTNLFEYELPYSKKRVRFKFMTGRDEEEIMVMNEKQKKMALGTESNVTTSLLYSIASIDGVTDRSKISNFIKLMPARDSLALREYIKDNEPGIVMRQDTTCDACGHSEEVSMPLGVTFLWPQARR